MFLAAGGVHVIKCHSEGEHVRQGTSEAMLHLNTLKVAEVEMMVSGMSAETRGYDETLLVDFNAVFVVSDQLIKSSLEADIVLCY